MATAVPLLLTQDQIDQAVQPETVALYFVLHEAGVMPEDESRGTMDQVHALDAQLAAAIAGNPEACALLRELSDAIGAVACESFEEGFHRGIAFTRWLAGRGSGSSSGWVPDHVVALNNPIPDAFRACDCAIRNLPAQCPA